MSIVLQGSTSGSVTLQEPAVAGTTVIDLPATSGTMVVTGGAQTIEFADGSAAAPSITNSGDTNTGIFFPAADTIAFTEGGAESMRIDSSGNVGIGLTPPVGSGNYRILNVGATVVYGNTGLAVAALNNNADINDKYVITGVASSYTQSSGNHLWYSAASGTAGNAISFTERMRITSGGKLLVGTATLFNNNDSGAIAWTSATGSGGEGGFEFQNTSTSTNSDANPALVIVKGSTTYTSAQRFIQFNANAGSQAMGGIVGNGATNVQFVSLSDVREKENIETILGSLNKVVALNPVEFDWKKTGEHITAGFIAQEVEQIFPEYVVDNVANAGEEERKGLTGGMSAGFIAHLVKAIQELNAKVEAQAARIAELEGVA